MLYAIGRTMRAQRLVGLLSSVVAPSAAFDFTGALPVDWTMLRAGTNATYRDSSGIWQAAAANAPRIHHDASGNLYGLLQEPARINYCTNQKFNPTALTNMTKTGDAAAVLSVVDAPAGWLAAVGLSALCTNGKVYYLDNSSGTSAAYIDFGGTVADTTAHSVSIFAAAAVDGYAGNVTLIGDASNAVISSSVPMRIKFANRIPDASTRQMRLSVAAGKGIYFIGNQLEKGTTVTSPIYSTSAASSSRAVDEVKVTSLNTKPWFNQNAGTVVWYGRSDPSVLGLDEQGIFALANDAASSTYNMSLRVTTAGRIDATYKTGSTDYATNTPASPTIEDEYVMGLSWDMNAGQFEFFCSIGMRFIRIMSVPVIGATIDALYLGKWQKYFGYATMTTRNLWVWDQAVSMADMAKAFMKADDVLIAYEGQSQAEGASFVTGFGTNGGEIAAINELGQYFTGRSALANHAVGGAGMFYRNNNVNYFYENDGITHGPVLSNALSALSAVKENIQALVWIQGSTDILAETKTTMKGIWLQVLTEMHSAIGRDIPVFMGDSCRRGDNALAETAYENWNAIIEELAAEHDWIHEIPTTKDLPMVAEWNSPAWSSGAAYAVGDTVRYNSSNFYCKTAHTASGSILPTNATYWLEDVVHLNDTAQAALCRRTMRCIASALGKAVGGPTMGPRVNNVSRSGTNVTVSLTHPAGITDFTPSSAIEGFVFTDNGSPISITSAVRTNATTITLTLASAPLSGIEVLKYAYGTCYGVDYTKLVRGNDSYNLPLQPFKRSL